jgi:para-nitrobenzyl esterase
MAPSSPTALRLLVSGAAAAAVVVTAAAAAAARPAVPQPLLDAVLDAARSAAAAAAARIAGAAPITIDTPYGPVTGADDGTVAMWLGVPFAAPPVGTLRWAPPVPPTPWTSPRNATWWGPVCMQDPWNFYWGLFSGGESEDCLTVNIYAPSPSARGTTNTSYPVLLWYYGGSFDMGAGGFPLYDGWPLVNATRDTIIVTMNYRVSTMGWLAGDPLRADSPDGSVGNWGLQDMRAALEWVAAAAPAFGGDPTRVTIAGESAGGGGVSHLLTNPKAWGLFHGAIMESGPLSPWITHTNYSQSAAFYAPLASAGNCSVTGPASLACLRALPAATVMSLGSTVGTTGLGPVVDGVEVTRDPRAAAAAGALAPGVPVLTGTNRDEGGFGAPNMTVAEFNASVLAAYGPVDGAALLALYSPADFPSPGAAWLRLNGDASMTCPNRDTARWVTAPSRGSAAAAAYVYLFVHPNAFLNALLPGIGVPHASDLLNVWGVTPLLYAPGEAEQSAQWGRFWTRFAATGNPNGGGDPEWAPYGGADVDSWALLDTGAGGPNVTNARGVRSAACDFWAAYNTPPPAAAPVSPSPSSPPLPALIFSAGFTDGTVLQQAPAAAAVYGLVFAPSSDSLPVVTVTLDDGSGHPVSVPAVVSSDAVGSGTSCDGQCYSAGYTCAVGYTSCCAAPSCPMGCAMGRFTPSLDACVAECRAAKGSCSYTINGSSIALNMCGDCMAGCPGCPDYEAQCEAGCAFVHPPAGSPSFTLAWKALLPPRPSGGAYTVTATCEANCSPGAAPSANISSVTFGLVFYASGQSNQALGIQYSFAFNETVAAIRSGRYANVRVFQYGGMSSQGDAPAPAWATTALTLPSWPWQTLAASLDQQGYSGFETFSALTVYFALSLTDLMLAAGDAAPPIGLITNAVGGTSIESWVSNATLSSCTNTSAGDSAAAPTVLFNGMAAPFVNTTLAGWLWAQGENNCAGDPGNSLTGSGYGCLLPSLVRSYRALWSAVPGTTDPLAPFGLTTIAAGGSEGNDEHVAAIRWSQTANYGHLPNPEMPNTFLAQAFDLGDPWLAAIDQSDPHHCAHAFPQNGSYGGACTQPWTNVSAWDPSLAPLAPLVRADTTPTFLGSIHARIKSPLGRRLAVAYFNLVGGGTGAVTGPTLAGCAYDAGAGAVTVAYNTTLLRGEEVLVAPFSIDTASWGTAGDSSTFMLCVLPAGKGTDPSACLSTPSLWSPVAATPGAAPATVTLTLSPAQRAGGTLAAVRYAWPLAPGADTCCPSSNVTRALEACTPGACPIKSAGAFLPGNPFYALIAPAGGACSCMPPQVCDAEVLVGRA